MSKRFIIFAVLVVFAISSEKGSKNIVVDIGMDQAGKSMISLTLAPK